MANQVIEAFVPSGTATPDVSQGYFAGDPELIAQFVAKASGWDEHNVRLVTHEIREIETTAVADVTEAAVNFKVAKERLDYFAKPVALTEVRGDSA